MSTCDAGDYIERVPVARLSRSLLWIFGWMWLIGALAELAAWVMSGTTSDFLKSLSRYVRFSAMGRYSRLYGGSAYATDVLANQSYLGQASVTLADFWPGDRGALSGAWR